MAAFTKVKAFWLVILASLIASIPMFYGAKFLFGEALEGALAAETLLETVAIIGQDVSLLIIGVQLVIALFLGIRLALYPSQARKTSIIYALILLPLSLVGLVLNSAWVLEFIEGKDFTILTQTLHGCPFYTVILYVCHIIMIALTILMVVFVRRNSEASVTTHKVDIVYSLKTVGLVIAAGYAINRLGALLLIPLFMLVDGTLAVDSLQANLALTISSYFMMLSPSLLLLDLLMHTFGFSKKNPLAGMTANYILVSISIGATASAVALSFLDKDNFMFINIPFNHLDKFAMDLPLSLDALINGVIALGLIAACLAIAIIMLIGKKKTKEPKAVEAASKPKAKKIIKFVEQPKAKAEAKKVKEKPVKSKRVEAPTLAVSKKIAVASKVFAKKDETIKKSTTKKATTKKTATKKVSKVKAAPVKITPTKTRTKKGLVSKKKKEFETVELGPTSSVIIPSNVVYDTSYAKENNNQNKAAEEALAASVKKLDSITEKFEAQADSLRKQNDAQKAEIKAMQETVALMSSGVDASRYEDVKLILKGKGLPITDDNIKKELKTHPEWIKKEASAVPARQNVEISRSGSLGSTIKVDDTKNQGDL